MIRKQARDTSQRPRNVHSRESAKAKHRQMDTRPLQSNYRLSKLSIGGPPVDGEEAECAKSVPVLVSKVLLNAAGIAYRAALRVLIVGGICQGCAGGSSLAPTRETDRHLNQVDG
jgi:hypothetical protein